LPTRIIGVAYLLLSGLALAVLADRAFAQDLGTDNPRVVLVIRLAAIALPGYPLLLGLLAAASGRPPAARFNPLGLPFEAWWVSTVASLTWRELKRFFFHPLAYAILGVYLCFYGVVFGALFDSYAGPLGPAKLSIPATYHLTTGVFMWLVMAILCPGITMRLVAEEDKLGTLEMLLTAPVTEVQVVLSKFIGALGFYAFMIAVTFIYVIIAWAYSSEWDWGPVFTAYMGLLLAGGIFLSIGLFCSSLTNSQVLAFLFTAGPLVASVLLLPYFAGVASGNASFPDWVRGTLRHINIMHHQRELAQGVVSFSDLTFYVSTIVFFLFLAVRGVESHKWRR
jgi:ABC-2 type transport system permease protein